MYISVNKRDKSKVYRNLMHYLFDHPEDDLSRIESIVSSIAAKPECAAEKKWMFDVDTDDTSEVNEFT